MGITGFQKYIKATYPCYQKKWLDSYDNVYFDLNHVLHLVVGFCSQLKHVLLDDRLCDVFVLDPRQSLIEGYFGWILCLLSLQIPNQDQRHRNDHQPQ